MGRRPEDNIGKPKQKPKENKENLRKTKETLTKTYEKHRKPKDSKIVPRLTPTWAPKLIPKLIQYGFQSCVQHLHKMNYKMGCWVNPPSLLQFL